MYINPPHINYSSVYKYLNKNMYHMSIDWSSLPELLEALLRPPVLRYSGYRHSLASPGTEEAWTGSQAESEDRKHGTIKQGLHVSVNYCVQSEKCTIVI